MYEEIQGRNNNNKSSDNSMWTDIAVKAWSENSLVRGFFRALVRKLEETKTRVLWLQFLQKYEMVLGLRFHVSLLGVADRSACFDY